LLALPSFLLLFLASHSALESDAALESENTYAVIVGVLEWQSQSYGSFSKENRRDQGLYDQLKARGVPEENMVLLLGQKATEKNMLAVSNRFPNAQERGRRAALLLIERVSLVWRYRNATIAISSGLTRNPFRRLKRLRYVPELIH